MTPQEQLYVEKLETELAGSSPQSYSQPYSPAMFGGQNKQNLVEWQLDFRAELEDIERLLRGDITQTDNDGNDKWVRNPDKDFVVFNDLGVNDIIREIRMFLNKNKVLSHYKFDEIKPRIRMFGHEMRSLIYNNAERYGLDNDYKINNYPMIVITIISMVEDAYRRAINGEERKGLNEARTVIQNDTGMQGGQGQGVNIYNNQGSNKKAKWYNPFTWGR